MLYFCCDRRRRTAVRGSALNGIDFVEVLDREAPTEEERQKRLFVHMVNDLSGPPLGPDNVRIEGGERITGIVVVAVTTGSGDEANVLTVDVDRPGDFSIYTLHLVAGPTDDGPPAGFDPQLVAVDFSFKAECPTDFDCRTERACPPAAKDEPEISYLARDYQTFRSLMLDRMAVLSPQWTERNPADLGVTLAEMLAHLGDQLSYQQDAVATEAYLGTARSRISVRRLVRLVDYRVSDGVSARTWVQVAVSADVRKSLPTSPPALPAGTQVLTRLPGEGATVAGSAEQLGRAEAVFSTREPLEELYAAHGELPFYTWSDRECCLPAGATRATLRGHFPDLAPGQVLILEEVLGPRTGNGADADPSRRQAVRLTDVQAFAPDASPLIDPLTAADPTPQQVTEISWHREDALAMPFCLSARTDPEHGSRFLADVTVARGNVALAEHGREISDEPLGTVPRPTVFRPRMEDGDRCDRSARVPVPARFTPPLSERPLCQLAPYDPALSAAAARTWPEHRVTPKITLTGTLGTDSADWSPQRDLLASGARTREFVVEVERDGAARIRFGDDRHGARPEPGTAFTASYRAGCGRAGNLGAGSLVHVAAPHAEIVAVRNPLPAWGGTDPETIEDVRQRAPTAFLTQERAVTEKDYAAATERLDSVQRAAATFRWTGSWHTVFVTVDRLGGAAVDEPFESDVRSHLERFRMAGNDLEVDGPGFVPLELELQICVEPGHFRADVRAAVLEVLSNRDLPDGRRGLFHPDRFSFGEPVYLSPILAAVQAVPGVMGVRATVFQRLGTPDPDPLERGVLTLGRLEIARLDNDPNFAEHGTLMLAMEGGS